MSTNKKWSILMRVVLALVLVGVGVAAGYYLWGRSPTPQAFFERHTKLLEALASVSADVSVRIITTPDNAAQFSEFAETGLETEYLKTQRVLYHKFIVVDGKKVLTGSYTWSQHAYKENWGNAVLVTNRAVAELFQLEFEYLWDLARPPTPNWDEMSCLERLNAARFADLVAVDGIADILALRILEYRENHGGFDTLDDLKDVYDIGPARSSAILEELGCSTP